MLKYIVLSFVFCSLNLFANTKNEVHINSPSAFISGAVSYAMHENPELSIDQIKELIAQSSPNKIFNYKTFVINVKRYKKIRLLNKY